MSSEYTLSFKPILTGIVTFVLALAWNDLFVEVFPKAFEEEQKWLGKLIYAVSITFIFFLISFLGGFRFLLWKAPTQET